MSSSSNPTEAAYKSAVEKLGLKSNIARALEIPDRELKVEIPFRRDNGEIDSVVGYRVQHNNTRGPFKGGIRYHHHVDIDEVRSLWASKNWKGKKPGDPLIVRGGYNCRHQWSFVNPDWFDESGKLLTE